MMLSTEAILRRSVEGRLRIGIGLACDEEKIMRSAESSSRYGEIVVYRDACRMCQDLHDGVIDAAVRGDLPSNDAMRALKDVFSLRKTQRMVLMEPIRGGVFLLAPVGIDEGGSVSEKVEMASAGHHLIRSLGGNGRVGMMSAGRESDRGRNPMVDKSMDDALEACQGLRRLGIECNHCQITIESALDENDVIIAPDGIIGNVIFRTLHFLGGARALGAPVANIDRVFIDTSRAKDDYSDSIALAYILAKEAE